MINAVFFDLYQTLVYFAPPREELHASVLKKFGIDVKPEVFNRPLAAADKFISEKTGSAIVKGQSEEDKRALWVQYEEVVLREAGIEVSEKLVLGLLSKMQQVKTKMVLFDDVIPALTDLKGRGLILGLISNIDMDINLLLRELELQTLIQAAVTSREAGFNKPHPEIFRAALRKAGVQAAESVFIGDQYQIDVIGANQAGLRGILLDRNGYYQDVAYSPCIQSLGQVAEHL